MNIDMKLNFKITRYKPANEIDWLKNIHTALVNKYYFDISDPIYDEYDIGEEIHTEEGYLVGHILDVIISEKDDKEYALIEMVKHVNFNSLIQLGVPIENIIFDCHHWNYNKDLENDNILY